MGKIENRINELGYSLPEQATPGGNYVPTVLISQANLIYTSGTISKAADGSLLTGKLGKDLEIEDGYAAAKQTGLNLLGSLKASIGDLDKVKRIVKLLCLVNSTDSFESHPLVANGCSDLLVEIFGDKGKHARSAIGVASLPNNVCVEIEMIVEITE